MDSDWARGFSADTRENAAFSLGSLLCYLLECTPGYWLG
jgi:hypothetical protein